MRKFFLFIAILSFSIAFSQEKSGFRINNLMVNLTAGDSVEVRFSIEALSKRLTSRGNLVLIPTILSDSQKEQMSGIVVVRKYSWFGQIFRKKVAVADSLLKIEIGRVANYSTKIPFAEWMNGAKLVMNFDRVSQPSAVISYRTLQTNLSLKREEIKSDKELQRQWRVLETLEFIFSSKGFDREVIMGIVEGKYSDVIKQLSQNSNSSADVLNLLGVAYGYSGDFDKARALFERAAEEQSKEAVFNLDELNRKTMLITL